MIIGIDIGGANTKVATADGTQSVLHYVPLWKDTTLPSVLEEVKDEYGPDRVGVVMTGELADCFKNKVEGARFIRDLVLDVFPDALFLDQDARLTSGEDPGSLAAANWVASTRLIGEEHGDGVFVDMGSTTSDVIPIKNGVPVAAKTDFKRLGRSELVYQGVLRTNLAALLSTVQIRGTRYRTSSELFATTGDVYLLLDKITSDQYTCETADNGPKDHMGAMRRLARLVCADLSELSATELYVLARQAMSQQVNTLAEAITTVAQREGLEHVYAAGLGEFIVMEAAKEAGIPCTRLSEAYGQQISKVFPAYAIAKLTQIHTEGSGLKPPEETVVEEPEATIAKETLEEETSLEEPTVQAEVAPITTPASESVDSETAEAGGGSDVLRELRDSVAEFKDSTVTEASEELDIPDVVEESIEATKQSLGESGEINTDNDEVYEDPSSLLKEAEETGGDPSLEEGIEDLTPDTVVEDLEKSDDGDASEEHGLFKEYEAEQDKKES